MSRTYSHGKNIHKKYKELTKSRACGYEYWSRRPYSNRCGCIPSIWNKRKTIRYERRLNKQYTKENQYEKDYYAYYVCCSYYS